MKKGYKIIDKYNDPSLINIEQTLAKQIKKKFPNFKSDLSELHNQVSKKDINGLRLFLFNYLNSKINWEDKIKKICLNELKFEIGGDILVQSKINLSIQMPNDKTSILPAHSDCWSSDSPFQLNLWIPLTNAYSSNSMFILDQKQSLDIMSKIGSNKLKSFNPNKIKTNSKQFMQLSFGQILLFNPGLIHGNILNKTKKTRVSLNLRFKSLFSPEPTRNNPDRKFGTYYKKFIISENTIFGTKLLKSGIFNEGS